MATTKSTNEKVSRFKDLKFKSKIKYRNWMAETCAYRIELVDKGFDLQSMWFDAEGECIDCNANQSIYLGRFFNIEKFYTGKPLEMWEDGKWITMGNLVIEEIIK